MCPQSFAYASNHVFQKNPKKQVFLKLKTIFISTNRDIYAKLLMKMFNKNKGLVRFDFCLKFVYISGYLQIKTFAWKRNCAIFLKLQNAMRLY